MASADSTTTDENNYSQTIAATARRLKALTQRSLQPGWHFSAANHAPADVLSGTAWQNWAIASRNARDHIAWPRGKQPLWLCQQITVPTTLEGFPLSDLVLRFGLTWWAEAVTVYVDGRRVQEGDLFDYFTRLTLSDRVLPKDTFTIAIQLLSPGHDDGALVRSELIFESIDPATPEPGFVADELTVLGTYAARLAPEKLSLIEAAITPLKWSQVHQQSAFLAELAKLRERLQSLSDWIQARQIICTGHAHLDLAWLWPVDDTWRAAERTFQSVLALQNAFPELTYTHSSPALFAWLETHAPELFQTVQQAIKQGHWSIDAGLWVEPELNTLGGESLARQILYGQRYSQSRFGAVSAIAWLPDSFGFSWQLPQLLKLGGIQYFATQKLRWNEATTFPHSLFWWQGLDGTRLLSLTLPPIGTDIDPVQMADHATAWETKTGFSEMLWLPGMGDHGGGPTRDMLEKARRWAKSPFFPQLAFALPLDHLQRLTAEIESSENITQASGPHPIPVWQDELYLELHRGCYTVHADQKWFNRRCEDALREAELFSAWAHAQCQLPYPRAALATAWQQVLFNQFHDILPGTAIPAVYKTANPDWQAAYNTAKALRTEALTAIAHHLSPLDPPHPDAVPIWVFNSLNWPQTDLVELALSELPPQVSAWQVFDPKTANYLDLQVSHYTDQHETPPCQPTMTTDRPAARLLFMATVPPLSYRQYWLVPALTAVEPPLPIASAPWQLENAYLRAVIDASTGDVVELWEQATATNVLRSPANQLQAFRDAGQYWDAWDIAPDYEQHPLPAAQLQSIQWLERGPLRQRLRVVRTVANSVLQQDYVLDQHLPYLKVATIADWQATQVVLKAAFPVGFEFDQATYEIPFGAIARPTTSTNPHEQAKWEVPAYRWASVSNGDIGFSLLTDYKHGFDTRPHQLRLTLLKAPLWPDPQADRGRHRFTYALYPHLGDWRQSRTPHSAIAFNTPLRAVVTSTQAPDAASTKTQDLMTSLLRKVLQESDRLHLAAIKLAEDDDCYVLRFWEMYGEPTELTLSSSWERTNLLETAIACSTPGTVAPWEIVTIKTATLFNESLIPAPTNSSAD